MKSWYVDTFAAARESNRVVSEASGELEAEPMLNMVRAGVPPDVLLLRVSVMCGGVLAGGDEDSDVNDVCERGMGLAGICEHVKHMRDRAIRISMKKEKKCARPLTWLERSGCGGAG